MCIGLLSTNPAQTLLHPGVNGRVFRKPVLRFDTGAYGQDNEINLGFCFTSNVYDVETIHQKQNAAQSENIVIRGGLLGGTPSLKNSVFNQKRVFKAVKVKSSDDFRSILLKKFHSQPRAMHQRLKSNGT